MNPTREEIRAARLRVGLTQTQAARLIYRSLKCWQQWEGGTRKMDPQLWETWQVKSARVSRLQFPKGASR